MTSKKVYCRVRNEKHVVKNGLYGKMLFLIMLLIF